MSAVMTKNHLYPWKKLLVLLAEAEEERAEADTELDKVLSALGFVGWRGG